MLLGPALKLAEQFPVLEIAAVAERQAAVGQIAVGLVRFHPEAMQRGHSAVLAGRQEAPKADHSREFELEAQQPEVAAGDAVVPAALALELVESELERPAQVQFGLEQP